VIYNRAIKKFQEIVGIAADGVYGPVTLSAIEIIMKKPTTSINSSSNKIVQKTPGINYSLKLKN
jgi:peptidoglycan hydrolase-like protein with peptidoglycan-binding domain